MKFYYLQDPNGYDSQLFSTKKAALDWIKNSNAIDDVDNEIFTEYDIQVLHIPQLTKKHILCCLLYTSPSPRDGLLSRMPSSA